MPKGLSNQQEEQEIRSLTEAISINYSAEAWQEYWCIKQKIFLGKVASLESHNGIKNQSHLDR